MNKSLKIVLISILAGFYVGCGSQTSQNDPEPNKSPKTEFEAILNTNGGDWSISGDGNLTVYDDRLEITFLESYPEYSVCQVTLNSYLESQDFDAIAVCEDGLMTLTFTQLGNPYNPMQMTYASETIEIVAEKR